MSILLALIQKSQLKKKKKKTSNELDSLGEQIPLFPVLFLISEKP